jgi:hypothetical protein
MDFMTESETGSSSNAGRRTILSDEQDGNCDMGGKLGKTTT